MSANIFDLPGVDLAWCPGCGDFPILDSLKQSLADQGLTPRDVTIVSGIGQAAKTPHFMKCHFFNGLHGRSLAHGTGVHAANPSLKVLVVGGDGDMYGEGGNHFIHSIRRNPDITNLVFNNMVYGLTKGQASPTSPRGMTTPIQVDGVISEPINPIALALIAGATFVARSFSGDKELTTSLITQAMKHKGYALIDILQPCVSFNKINTFMWFKKNSYCLGDEHDASDKTAALALATAEGSFPLGVIYREEGRPTFEDQLAGYRTDTTPLFKRTPDVEKLKGLVEALV